jgi:hypothetical protein
MRIMSPHKRRLEQEATDRRPLFSPDRLMREPDQPPFCFLHDKSLARTLLGLGAGGCPVRFR